MTKYVAYFRVSTAKQGRSGLGLEAQKAAVRRFLKPDDSVILEFTEVESGRNDARPQLEAALRMCRLHRGVLLVAKLDRLSRDVAFIASLLKQSTRIVIADMPDADLFRLHLEAVISEEEARKISARTRAALAAAKARGVALGGWKGHPISPTVQAMGNAVQASQAREMALALEPTLTELRAAGVHTTTGLADALNGRGIPTPRNGKWHAASVSRMLARLTPA